MCIQYLQNCTKIWFRTYIKLKRSIWKCNFKSCLIKCKCWIRILFYKAMVWFRMIVSLRFNIIHEIGKIKNSLRPPVIWGFVDVSVLNIIDLYTICKAHNLSTCIRNLCYKCCYYMNERSSYKKINGFAFQIVCVLTYRVTVK